MDTREKNRIASYHRRRQGLSPLRELGWRSPASQALRFEVLCRWGDLSGLTVLDLGCGHGDLKPHLDAHFSGLNYLGVDLLPEFVVEAQRRHGHLPNTIFQAADFLVDELPCCDVVIACGSLNYQTENVLHKYEVISRMWTHASKGIAFNMLDEDGFEADAFLCGHDSEEIHSYCRNLDPDAKLVTDYAREDFTILMWK